MLNIYSALYGDFSPFDTFYPEAKTHIVLKPEQLKPPGFLVILGGEDIHPSLYGKPNIASYVNSKEPSTRDKLEVALANTAINLGMPIVGICRGAQLGCALAGGLLIQHVDNHCGDHIIATHDGGSYITSSLHHQMMYPWNIDHFMLSWAAPKRSTQYVGLSDEEEADLGEEEPEIVWFPNIKCLAIQGHPEFMDPLCPFNKYVYKLMNEYITV